MKKTVKKAALLFSLMLALVLVLSAVALAATPNVYQNGQYTAQKMSNPTTGEGEADGLEVEATRMNSYAWCMGRMTDQYGDYVYIGTNRNILYGSVANGLVGEIDHDIVASLVKAVSNDEIFTECEQVELAQAVIVRYNVKNGEIETWFTPENYPYDMDHPENKDFAYVSAFRVAQNFKGQLYINATVTDPTSRKQGTVIYRIPNNNADKPEVVFEDFEGGTLLRAMTVSTDGRHMYFGGTTTLPEFGCEGTEWQIVIYETATGNNGSFKPIADASEKVFQRYESDNKYHSTGGDVWDLVEYQDQLWMTLMTNCGGMVFTAHKDASDHDKNKYDWVWKEFAGESAESEYAAGFGNKVNYSFSPIIFRGDLYFLGFTNAFDPVVKGMTGLLRYLGEENGDINVFLDSLEDMERSLDNEASMFRLTKGGKMQMIMGDKKECPDNIMYVAKNKAGFNDADYSTTLYTWRAAEYNGKLYVGTFDAYTLFKYITKLTNGDLLNMTENEFRQQLDYVKQFIELLQNAPEPEQLEQQPEQPEQQPAAAQAAGSGSAAQTQVQVQVPTGDELSSDPTLAALQQVAAFYNVPSDGQSTAVTAGGSGGTAAKLTEAELEALFDVLVLLQQNTDKQAATAFISQMLLSIPDAADQLDTLFKYLNVMQGIAGRDYAEYFGQAKRLVAAVRNALEDIDPEGLARYVRISDTLAANDNPGFELYCTSDGINYDTITLDGFGDEYNYGCRTLMPVTDGLLLGTANPFFGAQLWKVTGGGQAPEPVQPSPQPDPEDDPQDDPQDDDFPFTDVHKGDWSYNDIYYVWQQNLMSGTSATLFSPNQQLTRGMVMAIIYRMEGKPAFRNDNIFTDVAPGSYYEKAIAWANGKGIAKGVSADKFAPNQPVTREQLAAFLYRYAKYKGYDVSVGENTNILSYDDAASVSSYAIPAISWAVGTGIIKGSANCLLPQNTATRAEAAAMFHRFDKQLNK